MWFAGAEARGTTHVPFETASHPLIVLVIAAAFWIRRRSAAAPLVPFAKLERETLVSTLSTDGRVAPSDRVWSALSGPGSLRESLSRKDRN